VSWRTGRTIRVENCVTSGSPVDTQNVPTGTSNTASYPSSSLTTGGDNELLVWIGTSFSGFHLAASGQPSGFTINAEGSDSDSDNGRGRADQGPSNGRVPLRTPSSRFS